MRVMVFSQLNASVVDLRNTLCSFVGERAFRDATVRPPVGEDSEISFLRLVAWSYAVVFEAGRVAIPYLLQLPGGTSGTSSDAKVARRRLNILRTWSVHNLGFGSNRDASISRDVQRWFMVTSGMYPPEGAEAWRSCFLALCSDVRLIVEHCQGAMTNVLLAPDDGNAAMADLRRRIDRSWPAEEFHKVVGDAVIRLGMRIDAEKFSGPRLSRWREFLETVPDSDDLAARMVPMIERDLIDHVADVLPINGRDVMDRLGLAPGRDVGDALLRARELFRSGIVDPAELLERLKDESTPSP